MTEPHPDEKKVQALVNETAADPNASAQSERDLLFYALMCLSPEERRAYSTGWVGGWIAAKMGAHSAREHIRPPDPMVR